MPGFPVHHPVQLLNLTQTHIHQVGVAIQPFHPLCPLFLLSSIFPSIRVFSNQFLISGGQSIRVSASASVLPVNIHGLISFRFDWFDLLADQGTLKSSLTIQHSAFFTVQLSHPYTITGKTIALTRRTFVGKVKSLLFNMLSKLVMAFLPRSKHLLISWLQSPSAVILEPPKIKSLTVSIVCPSICRSSCARE